MGLKIKSNNRIDSLNTQTALQRQTQRAQALPKAGNGAFLEALRQAGKGANVTFSKHAEQRIHAWNGDAKTDYVGELDSAMDIAQAKGARSTLVLMKGVAFVVAPQSRTVVTVIPEDRMRQNLFTSIDSAVIMDK
ncbi:MAG TPA: hypothetical protein GX529_04360 [Firmicutes bacterium]|nr:hypothetical protein [Candidatus Fermentithermobacillaceae bacterium]